MFPQRLIEPDGPRTMEEIQHGLPSRVMRLTLQIVLALFLVLIAWSIAGELDIIASADGRLVPQTFVKIVQPADPGVIQEILVKEGERVQAGQVLLRMDRKLSDADAAALKSELDNRGLQIRRIDAELSGQPLTRRPRDRSELYEQVEAQWRARRQNYLDTLAQEQQALQKAQHELSAARELRLKLQQSVPILKRQADNFGELSTQGYVPGAQAEDKLREFLERAQELKAQESTVNSVEAGVYQSQQRLKQISSNYRSNLNNERVEAEGQLQKLQQDWIKLEHKASLLELKAPQSGFIKDLATHTIGTVVTPGTILLTLVPESEPLVAEVLVKNDDVGFVHAGQEVKIKLVAYPFQKYGMLDGVIAHLGVDSQDVHGPSNDTSVKAVPEQSYKALVSLSAQTLEAAGTKFRLISGMQVIAEINGGKRTVLEYLLSPIQRTVHDSARER
jgi:HlyD family secretion protein